MIISFQPHIITHIVFDVDDTLVFGTGRIKDQVWENVIFHDSKSEIVEVNKIFDKQKSFPDGTFVQGDRYDRIAYMLGYWSESDDSFRDNPEVQNLAELFQDEVAKQVASIRVSKEVRAMLHLLKEKGMNLYVSSNVPQSVLEQNTTQWGIADYFDEVFGTPKKKIDVLKMLVEEKNVPPENILMVGDGSIDQAAAVSVGTQFVKVSQNLDNNTDSFIVISSVSDLEDLFYKK